MDSKKEEEASALTLDCSLEGISYQRKLSESRGDSTQRSTKI